MRLPHILLTIFLTVSSHFFLCAQNPIFVPEHRLDSLSKVARVSESPLRFAEEVHDFGEIKEADGRVTYVFNCTNISDSLVRILRVVPTCSCVDAVPSVKMLRPDGEMQVSVTFNPERRSGDFEQKVFMYGTSRSPMAALRIKGQVIPKNGIPGYPVVMGDLRLSRSKVSFSELSAGQKREERIACANAGERSLKITAMPAFLPDWISVRTEPASIAPGKTGDIVICVDVDKISMLPPSGRISVILEGIAGRPSERSIEVTVTR
ncbi:MAG: DUF1573 domain-containing protein [Candidatus Cryptobacteroides sp.]